MSRASRVLLATAVALGVGAPWAPAHAATPDSYRAAYGSGTSHGTLTVYPAGRAVIVFVHGGCWRRGPANPFEQLFARRLRHDTGATVVVLSYPAPATGRWLVEPAAVSAAVARVQAIPAIDPRRVALWGESAGGHLALMTAYSPRGLRAPVRAVASISGPTELRDMAGSMGFDCTQELVDKVVPTDSRWVHLSPAELTSGASPRTYFASAAGDPFIKVTHGQRIAQELGSRAEVDVVPGIDHAGQLEGDAYRPDSSETVMQRAEAFLMAALR